MKQTIKSTICSVLAVMIVLAIFSTPAAIVTAAQADAGNSQHQGDSSLIQIIQKVQLNQKFSLVIGETAEIQDYNNMRIILKEIVQSPCALCLQGSDCPPCSGSRIINLEVFKSPDQYVERTRFYLSEGEHLDVFGARIVFNGFDSNSASLTVKKIGSENSPGEIPVYLNNKFDLRQTQTAVVKDYQNLKIVYTGEAPMCAYTCSATAKCAPPPCSKGGISLKISMASGQTESGTEMTLYVGESKEAFKAMISLKDLENGVARLVVSADRPVPPPIPPTPIVPMCKYGGTKSEGWYVGNQLVAYDKCISVAQCMIGSNGIGWYSSLTGRLIQKEQCAVPVPIEITNRPIQDESLGIADNAPIDLGDQIRSGPQSDNVPYGEFVVREETPTEAGAEGSSSSGSSGQSEADYTTEIQTKSSNLAESDIGTSILRKLQEDQVITAVTSIQQKEVDGRQVYDIHGTKTKKFLWIFPMQQSVTVRMDAETQEWISK